MVAVAVGVDDDADGQGGQLPEVRLDLGGLAVADPGVDEQGRLVAEDDADVLVVEGIAPDEDAVADLGPGAHVGQRSRSPG